MKRLDRHSRAIIVLALVVTLAAMLLTFGHWLPTASMQSTQDVVVEEVSRDVAIDQKFAGNPKKENQSEAEAIGNFAPDGWVVVHQAHHGGMGDPPATARRY